MHPGVDIGHGVRIGRNCRLFLDDGARLLLGDRCEIDDGSTIAAYGTGIVELGQGVFVGHHSTIAARASVYLGPGTYLAELVSVRDHDHAVGLPPSSGEVAVDPVVIAADVWVGAKATILRGTNVGEGTVVGANAVARGVWESRTVYAGVPVRRIRSIDP
jgi:acetyltransferase-like isoleucine patch superfamily enzyme